MPIEGIEQLIQGEVETTAEARQKFSRDASIFEVTPEAILYPKDVADLKALITHVSERRRAGVNVSLSARNGGTCMSGGSLTESYVVNMSRYFNRISPVDTVNRKLTVQGGVMHLEVEKATHPLGLYFPPYTSSHDICGIGGMIGNNASGEKSVKYGPTSSNVKRLKAVLSDGNEYEFGPLTATEVAAKRRLPGFEGELYRGVTKGKYS